MKQVITAQLTDAEIMTAVAAALCKARGVTAVGPVAFSVTSMKCAEGNLHNVVLEFDAAPAIGPAPYRMQINFDPGEN